MIFDSLCKSGKGTCFILGSGPSVHSQNLNFLKNYTTIAVNGGYLRYLDADYFLSDDQDVNEWSYCFNDLKNSSKTKVLLFEWKFNKHGYWKECQKWYGDRLYSFSHRRGYHLTHKYKHNDPDYGIWQARTSAGTAVHCAYLMGFREIVLLGIDCVYENSKRHFYELGGYTLPTRRKPFFQRRFIRKNDKNTTDSDLIEVLNYWESVPRNIGDRFKILNGSPVSVIKNIPKVDINCYVQKQQNCSPDSSESRININS